MRAVLLNIEESIFSHSFEKNQLFKVFLRVFGLSNRNSFLQGCLNKIWYVISCSVPGSDEVCLRVGWVGVYLISF